MKNKSAHLLTYLFVLFFVSSLYAQDAEEVENTRSVIFSAVEGSVNHISENADGTLIAVSDNKTVLIYDAKTFSPVWKFYDEGVARTAFYSEGTNDYFAIMTKDGQFIVRSFSYEDGQWQFDDGEPYFSADCADVTGRKSLTAVSFSNNSDYVAAAFNDNSVQVHFRLRVTAGSISQTITSHKAPVYGLEFSKNGAYLATVSTDGQAYIWNSYTSAKITQLDGIYARARVPVCFSEDLVYIISLDSRNSFRISDFSGNTLYSILTGRPITAIKPLRDPDLLAIRNDKNEVMVYSISARRPLSVVTVTGSSACTTFEFSADASLMYAGFADGQVSIVEPQPYLDEKSMLVTDSTLIGTGKGNGSTSRFQNISITAGANYLNKPYLIAADLRGEYLYSEVISPFFVGGGLNLSMGFPRKEFPTNYKVNGEDVGSPKLFSAAVYAPMGYAFSPFKKDMTILTTAKVGLKITNLALITNSGSAIGKPVCSVFLGIGAGMQIKWFTFDLNCEYDSIGKVSPSIYAGYVWKWGNR